MTEHDVISLALPIRRNATIGEALKPAWSDDDKKAVVESALRSGVVIKDLNDVSNHTRVTKLDYRTEIAMEMTRPIREGMSMPSMAARQAPINAWNEMCRLITLRAVHRRASSSAK